jgi:hypothetical protein
MTDPEREDKYVLPPPGTEWKLEPEEDERLFMVKDHSSAAMKAAEAVWHNHVVIESTCFVHASTIWLSKSENKHLFNDIDNIENFQADLNTYKLTPFIHMVDPMHHAFIAKWRDIEPRVAEKWEKSWGGKRITMVEANEDCPLRGGKPSDNNTLESTNNKDKEFVSRLRAGTMPLVQQVVERVQHHSYTDLVFNGDLKSKSDKVGDVHSGAFYAGVQLNLIAFEDEGKSSCLAPTRSLNSTRHGIRGSIVCSDSLLADLKKKGKLDRADTIETVNERVSQFRRLIRKPDAFLNTHGFDVAGELIRDFIVIEPLDPTGDENLKVAIMRLVDMLEFNGLRMLPYDEILDLEDEGLVSCTCHTYLLRGWCKHSATYARQRGIMKNYPKNRNPTVANKPRVGRPSNSASLQGLCRRSSSQS